MRTFALVPVGTMSRVHHAETRVNIHFVDRDSDGIDNMLRDRGSRLKRLPLADKLDWVGLHRRIRHTRWARSARGTDAKAIGLSHGLSAHVLFGL